MPVRLLRVISSKAHYRHSARLDGCWAEYGALITAEGGRRFIVDRECREMREIEMPPGKVVWVRSVWV